MISLINLVPYLFLAQETETQTPQMPAYSAAFSLPGLIGGAVISAFCFWKVFTKAGQPGWASIIPIVNLFFLCKVAGRPAWWVLLLLICFPIFWIIISLDVAKRFGKGVGFAIGLMFLGIIFYPILGFGSAQYQGAPAPPATA
jgi:Family of unknown function (DUF5684)